METLYERPESGEEGKRRWQNEVRRRESERRRDGGGELEGVRGLGEGGLAPDRSSCHRTRQAQTVRHSPSLCCISLRAGMLIKSLSRLSKLCSLNKNVWILEMFVMLTQKCGLWFCLFFFNCKLHLSFYWSAFWLKSPFQVYKLILVKIIPLLILYFSWNKSHN